MLKAIAPITVASTAANGIAAYGSYKVSMAQSKAEKTQAAILADQAIFSSTSELIESSQAQLQDLLESLNTEIQSASGVLAEMSQPLAGIAAEQ